MAEMISFEKGDLVRRTNAYTAAEGESVYRVISSNNGFSVVRDVETNSIRTYVNRNLQIIEEYQQ